MAWIAADDEDDAPAADDFATFANALDAGADLHGSTIPGKSGGLVESESV
jgi:hypothetical protein